MPRLFYICSVTQRTYIWIYRAYFIYMDLQGKFFSKRAPVDAFGVGLSLDPEGRKRILVLGSSFALKKRKMILS